MEKLGYCTRCHEWHYLFASQLCMTCEDARLVGIYRDPNASDEDREMLSMFREYVRDVAGR